MPACPTPILHMLLPPRSQTSLSFCIKKRLRCFFKIMRLVAFFFSDKKAAPVCRKLYWETTTIKILNDLLSCEEICMASYCWSFWIKQQCNVRCLPKVPLFPLWSNQFCAGEPCTRQPADWIIQQLLERGSAAPFTSYHPQPNLVLDCFNS